MMMVRHGCAALAPLPGRDIVAQPVEPGRERIRPARGHRHDGVGIGQGPDVPFGLFRREIIQHIQKVGFRQQHQIRDPEHGRIFRRLVVAFRRRQQRHIGVLAEIEAGRTDQIADILDKQDIDLDRSSACSASCTIWASRWQVWPVVICTAATPWARIRSASFSVSRSPSITAIRYRSFKRRDGRLQKAGLARARGRHQIDREHPMRVQMLAVMRGLVIIFAQDMTDQGDGFLADRPHHGIAAPVFYFDGIRGRRASALLAHGL